MKEEFVPTAAGVEAYLDHLKMVMELGFATGQGKSKEYTESRWPVVEEPKEWGK